MSVQRHEIPTHLDVEDRALYGLTVRQLMWLTVGAAAGYGLWNQWPSLPLGLRLALAAACVLLAVTLALVRPHGRGLEEWAFVALHYAALPKVCIWSTHEPDPEHARVTDGAWETLAPRLAWRVSPDDEEVAP